MIDGTFGVESLSTHEPAQAGFRNLRTHNCLRANCAAINAAEESAAEKKRQRQRKANSGE